MSWDVYLEIDTGDSELTSVCEVGNYTYNVSSMYVDAMGCSISCFDGRKAYEVALILKKGIEELERNPSKYIAMNPKNEWGDYGGALSFLKNFYKACVKHNKTTVRVC